jgi:hypothetical protein
LDVSAYLTDEATVLPVQRDNQPFIGTREFGGHRAFLTKSS